MTQIKKHADSLTAVLILVNGTVPGVTIGTYNALSTLTTILPNTLSSKIAFLLTNVSEPLYQNFSRDNLPDVLKHTPEFLLNNPIALQKRHLELRNDPKIMNKRTEMCSIVKDGEQMALEALVDLSNWLGGVDPQATTQIAHLRESSENIAAKIIKILAQLMQEFLKILNGKVRGVSGRSSSASLVRVVS